MGLSELHLTAYSAYIREHMVDRGIDDSVVNYRFRFERSGASVSGNGFDLLDWLLDGGVGWKPFDRFVAEDATDPNRMAQLLPDMASLQEWAELTGTELPTVLPTDGSVEPYDRIDHYLAQLGTDHTHAAASGALYLPNLSEFDYWEYDAESNLYSTYVTHGLDPIHASQLARNGGVDKAELSREPMTPARFASWLSLRLDSSATPLFVSGAGGFAEHSQSDKVKDADWQMLNFAILAGYTVSVISPDRDISFYWSHDEGSTVAKAVVSPEDWLANLPQIASRASSVGGWIIDHSPRPELLHIDEAVEELRPALGNGTKLFATDGPNNLYVDDPQANRAVFEASKTAFGQLRLAGIENAVSELIENPSSLARATVKVSGLEIDRDALLLAALAADPAFSVLNPSSGEVLHAAGGAVFSDAADIVEAVICGEEIASEPYGGSLAAWASEKGQRHASESTVRKQLELISAVVGSAASSRGLVPATVESLIEVRPELRVLAAAQSLPGALAGPALSDATQVNLVMPGREAETPAPSPISSDR